MQRVIVTVQRNDEARGRDLEAPAELPAVRLAELIVQALRWPVNSPHGPITYQIEAHPPGRALRGDETLADVGAWDGARLVLAPEATPAGYRWRRLGGPLEADAPATAGPAAPDPPGRSDSPTQASPLPAAPEPDEPPSRGFVWKQLDG
jgi:WXG100 protein secretion system (Wss), protein YukD